MLMEPTIRQLLNNADTKLDWSPTPRLDAELLLAYVLRTDRTYIATNPNEIVSSNHSEIFQKMILRRQKREPLAHIIGEKEFYGFNFKVTKDTLIPRPETELIVDIALKLIFEKTIDSIVDVGTGSGCIIISLAKEVYKRNSSLAKSMTWLATDTSKKAMNIATTNHKQLLANTDISINLLHGSLLAPVQRKVDLIISNPPYIPKSVYETLEVNVKNFEPKDSLIGGETGTEIIQLLFLEANEKLNVGGTILLEINYDQADTVKKLTKRSFPNATVEIVKDYAGLDRIAIIQT